MKSTKHPLRRPTRLLPMLCLLAAVATAQPGYREVQEMPAGPVGQRISQVLDALNTADAAERAEKVRQIVEQSMAPPMSEIPLDEHLAVFGEIYDSSRGLEFYGMRVYDDPSSVPPGDVAILRNRLTEGWQALVVQIEDAQPHRISSLGFPPARPPADLPTAAALDSETFIEELRGFVGRLAEADAFSGTVLVARGDEVVFEGAWGEASKRFSVPNKVSTRFNLGSMNKMFTAVAILQLEQEGKLALSDPLSKHLDGDWLDPEIARKVTVEHLLTHTSGLGSYFNEQFMDSSRARFRSVDDYKSLVSGETLRHEPGADWSYSNTGFLLLGAVIEAVSGQSYFDFVRDRIYEGAGMARSDSYEMDAPVPDLAIGYLRENGEWRNNYFLHVIKGGPAGGGFSTVRDLHRFARALMSGKLLPPDAVERLTTVKPDLGSPTYGYGFGVEQTSGERIVGHTGGFPGINSALDIYTESGWVVAVMSNYSNGAGPVHGKIGELIRRVQ